MDPVVFHTDLLDVKNDKENMKRSPTYQHQKGWEITSLPGQV